MRSANGGLFNPDHVYRSRSWFAQGLDARLADMRHDANPFERGSIAFSQWQIGWREQNKHLPTWWLKRQGTKVANNL